MLIVMSDLHLAESQSLSLPGLQFNHNLPARVYQEYFRVIAESLDDGVVPEVDLALAGEPSDAVSEIVWQVEGASQTDNATVCIGLVSEAGRSD